MVIADVDSPSWKIYWESFIAIYKLRGKKDVDVTEDDYRILYILQYWTKHVSVIHGNNTQYHVSQLVCALWSVS